MNEVLYIRLNSHADAPIGWLVWSSSENEIIASGELESADSLSSLSEKAQHRKVVAIVPSQDVSLKSLNIPAKSQRAFKAAAPYMLEEELAQDVEQLFFAYGIVKSTSNDNCFVALVKRSLLADWLSWLDDADIHCQIMIPEVLAMPLHDDNWTAAQIGDQIVVRQGQWQGTTLDISLWPLACEQWSQQPTCPEIYSYTTLPETPESIDVQQQPQELLLALIAQSGQEKFNLLQGEFAKKDERSPMFKHWAIAAGICLVALLLSVTQKGAELYQLKAQQEKVEARIIETYTKAFPDTKRVRISTIKSQLKRKMSGVAAASNDQGFLAMLSKLEGAYAKVPSLRTMSIKFDAKRGEIRLNASANDFQVFDRFKSELEKVDLVVTQGAQNSQGNLVTGSLSIKGRS